MARRTPYLQPLFDGPLDVIGDVHGELGALHGLLRTLGYDARGAHPEGRRLVFVGDLCDRGPDSPGVLAAVRGLCAEGRAQAVLGNHEVNLLRGSRKHGNGWFFDGDHDRARGEFAASAPMPAAVRDEALAFLRELPVGLARDDLRVVHAVWDGPSLERLGDDLAGEEPEVIHGSDRTTPALRAELDALEAQRALEMERYGAALRQREERPPLLEAVGRSDALWQRGNPLRVLTSGLETLAERPYFAGGAWRMTDRVRWWDDYRDDVPVVFGHYWRWSDGSARAAYSKGEPDLFRGASAQSWLGARSNAFCVDFSAGARYRERAEGRTGGWRSHLAALRWPERELVLDEGPRLALG